MFKGMHWDRKFAISVYETHVETVVDLVPEENLLRYWIAEGWEPLCRFLDVEVPSQPFPHHNKRSAFPDSAPEWAKQHMKRFIDRGHSKTGTSPDQH
jgi:hypothetical protein